MKLRRLLPTVTLFALAACAESIGTETAGGPSLEVEYEKYTLDNGLDVIFHIDRSDPIVAVAMTYHVGSAREVEGRTGFAHLFEHLLFLESENLGKGGLDILINRVGGTLNGSTTRDRTNYYQVVPNDALEKILWAEADKMGFFIKTVTEPVLAKEKQVVKNEKRQGVDNAPYGHTSYVIDSNLYPPDHPYHWQVIGSLEDLQAATLDDVHTFYNEWYTPDNATLVVAGDFDTAQAREWVERYFGEFERAPERAERTIPEVTLEATESYFHEDNFARLPALTMAWPTVPQYHIDGYALDMLAALLTDGQSAPFYEVLVEEKEITGGVSAFQGGSELAGRFTLSSRGFAGIDLDELRSAVDEAFLRFETEGIDERDLERIKAGQETGFYNGLSSVLGKAFQLAQYNIFADDPGFVTDDIQNFLNVTADDVMRVYEQYIRGQNHIVTSFVPRGEADLALEGSVRAEVVEEPIVIGLERPFELPDSDAEFEPTPSRIDRTVEPPFGDPPTITPPTVWSRTLSNGLDVLGIVNDETPLVQFNLRVEGGLLLEDPNRTGVSQMMANLMTQGTATKTPEELETAIDQIGSSISVNASTDAVTISGTTLSRNFDATMELVREILLEPRWDEREFELIKARTLDGIRQRAANPNAIAAAVYSRLLYGDDHILSKSASGTMESVESITLDDLQAYYAANLSPSVGTFHVAGDVDAESVMTTLSAIESGWSDRPVEIPDYPLPEARDDATVYFVDVPGAVQSVLRVGNLALAQTDDDFYPANVMNFRLGGGGFASEILQVLREQRGYTYGANSNFSGTTIPGPFTVSTSVRANVTYESLDLIQEMLSTYQADFNEQDLAATTGFLLKSGARSFETLGAKIGMLQNISRYGFAPDYVKQRETIVRDMTVERVRELAGTYIHPDRMIWLIVGDAETQAPRLAPLGLGEPVFLDVNGDPVDSVSRE